MADVLVVSGSGPYADAWHRFPETSRRLAEILSDLGHRTRVTEDVEVGLADPGRCDLLVVNIGDPAEPRPPDRLSAVRRGLVQHVDAGRGLLGIHVSATSLTELPEWPTLLGGHWVRGRTMHPPQDLATVRVCAGVHPVVEGLDDFEVDDERYSYLETGPDITVLCEHEFEGRRHPLAWAKRSGRGRVVYDALGHDVRSYDSAPHVELLQRSVRWLLGDL
jgi:uncharacterized protein